MRQSSTAYAFSTPPRYMYISGFGALTHWLLCCGHTQAALAAHINAHPDPIMPSTPPPVHPDGTSNVPGTCVRQPGRLSIQETYEPQGMSFGNGATAFLGVRVRGGGLAGCSAKTRLFDRVSHTADSRRGGRAGQPARAAAPELPQRNAGRARGEVAEHGDV
jgi:hypothetical protein